MEEVKDTPVENQETVTEAESKENTSAPESKEVAAESEANKPVPESDATKSEKSATETNNSASELENVDLLKKIQKQIEYYFGDNNMRRDKFLLEQTRLDDGWVPISVMLNFKNLAALTKNVEAILKSLENSDLIQISEDKKKIRRSVEKPLPKYDEEYLKAQEARTLYLKGFPLTLTIEELINYYDSADVENIIMRKYTKDKQKFFKGSIFLQFKTLEAAKAFMEEKSTKYQDTELIKLWAKDYNAGKEKEKEEKQQKKLKNVLSGENEKSKNKNDKREEGKKRNFSKGCVLHISNIPVEFSREVIKEKVSEMSEVAYIDHKTGQTEGWIRLQGENSAVELIKKLENNKIKINDTDIICKLLEGEEEESYFVKVQEDMSHHRNKRRDGGRRGRRNFKRRHSPGREENGKRFRVGA